MRVVSKYGLNGPYTVLDESTKYYIVRDAVGHSIALDKQEWEPVPEWVDVTHECVVVIRGTKQMIMHKSYELGDCSAVACLGTYRLVAAGLQGIRVEKKQ